MNARIKRKVNKNKIYYALDKIFCACVNHTEFEDNKFIVPQKTVIQWRDLLGDFNKLNKRRCIYYDSQGVREQTKKKDELDFDTTDIVLVKGHDEYMDVMGVIHDDERLFVACATKQEFEVPFSDVEKQFKQQKI